MRHGFVLIDKPLGPTSHDVVGKVRRALGERSVGHLGTLDPAASGLLVLAVGTKALRVVELFMGATKEYLAGVTFGTTSSTYDGQGVLETFARQPGVSDPTEEDLLRVIRDRFLGRVSQVPPTHSAIHVNGERAYEAARAGRALEMPVREVHIERCSIVRYAYPALELDVRCSSGTYIRSLAHDLGTTLRCGAYLSSLRRTAIGAWRVGDAVSPERVGWNNIVPLHEVLLTQPKRIITTEEWQRLQHGRDILGTLEVDNVIAWLDDRPVAVLTTGKEPGALHPRKVIN